MQARVLSWLNILDWVDGYITALAPGLVMAWILTVKQVIAPEAFHGLYEETVYLEVASLLLSLGFTPCAHSVSHILY